MAKLYPVFLAPFESGLKTRTAAGKLRPRWRMPDGWIHERDYQHGTVEVYDGRRGDHRGEYDPFAGRLLKGAVAGRRIDP